ncbi:hypothetical protein ACFQDN_20185 [Pseudomonas asuensis]|uniref:DUF7740 domain-containing protein n=1 Tax=Pseudomonas asuensis TaxID=1825787 RepID=A0ABQ2H360_9PSED|nr:hypothetical protein [Pseudomonas asuensis]GGM31003.1 hypothetical protein GCM10009425_47080 [Pseudomonas asuensis]
MFTQGKASNLTFLDAIVALALIAEIHGTDKAVADAAKRFSKQLPRRYRQYMYEIMNSRSPLRHIKLFITTLPDDILDLVNQEGAIAEDSSAITPLKNADSQAN